jgi:heme-degrading monooxygenase HmoA
MPVTKFALLRIKSPTTIDALPLREGLRKAKSAMETFTGNKFYYLQQVEDPSYVYILGEWASLKQHYDEWIPSQENKDLLEALKDELDVEWLSHLDVPVAQIPLDAPILSIGRHFIKQSTRDAFENCFQTKRKFLDAFVTEGNTAGGWKVDDGRDGEEFVLFAPWKEVQQHMDFAKDDGFEEYATIREFVASAGIKHVKVADIGE